MKNSHSYSRLHRHSLLNYAAGLAVIFSVAQTKLNAATQYIDVNGTTAGFGDYVYTSGGDGSGGMYNFTASIFTSDPTGVSAPVAFASGSDLVYDASTTTGNFAVRLPGGNNPNTNFALGSLSLINNTGNYTANFNNGFFYANTFVLSGGNVNVSSGTISINDRDNISGSYTKIGTGNLTLNGTANGFGNPTVASGTATISAGKIIINTNLVTGSTSNFVLNGGALQIQSGAVALGVVSGTGSSAFTSTTTTTVSAAGLVAGTDGTAGTLTVGLTNASTLDLSAITGTGGLKFDLGSSSDLILFSNTTSLNVGTLDFSDFTFNAISGFGAGTYTLFDTQNSILGSIGTASGNIGSYNGTLSIAGQDLVLTVAVPEPSTAALILTGCAALFFIRRKVKVVS